MSQNNISSEPSKDEVPGEPPLLPTDFNLPNVPEEKERNNRKKAMIQKYRNSIWLRPFPISFVCKHKIQPIADAPKKVKPEPGPSGIKKGKLLANCDFKPKSAEGSAAIGSSGDGNDNSDSTQEDLDDFDFRSFSEITVMVRWGSEVFKFSLAYYEKIPVLKMMLAERIQKNVDDIKLFLGNSVVDTSLQVGALQKGEILDCNLHSWEIDHRLSQNEIKLRFKTSVRREMLSVVIERWQPMTEALKQFASKFSLELDELTMKFDDDNINPDDTPNDLFFIGDEWIFVY